MGSLSKAEAVGALASGPQVHANQPVVELIETAIKRGEARLAANGALVANTVPRTGRSPKDKFTVDDEVTHALVHWGKVNQPFSTERFDALLERVLEHMRSRELFVQNLFCGADPAYRLPIRVISEYAWHALFVRQLFVRPEPAELAAHTPEFTVVAAPEFQAVPERDGTRSGAFILADFARKIILIGGTKYAGEIKKSIFGVMNFLVPSRDVLPMHCSANVGADGVTALFFGLSGTGKTTLSADPARRLIGDDEHGWSATGIFNFEGGCYAKCVDLSEEKEPQIYRAIRFGSVLENVILDPATGAPDYADIRYTENTARPIPSASLRTPWSQAWAATRATSSSWPPTHSASCRPLRGSPPSRPCITSSPAIRPSWPEPKPVWARTRCRSSQPASARRFCPWPRGFMRRCWAGASTSTKRRAGWSTPAGPAASSAWASA